MKNEKSLVWVTKEFAEQIERLENGQEYEELVLKYIERSKDNIKRDVDALDENVIRYMGLMIKAKNAFEEACEHAEERAYSVWEEFDKADQSYKKIAETRKSLAPVIKDLETIDSLLSKLNLYDIERLLKILRELDNLGGPNRQILANLLNIQGKD